VKQRLVGGVTSAQSVEADALIHEVDFTVHQSMEPMLIAAEGFEEQMHVAVPNPPWVRFATIALGFSRRVILLAFSIG